MNFDIKPKQDRIVVEVVKKEEMTKSGIIIPDAAKELPNQAIIIATGPGKFSPTLDKFVKPDVEVGDRVLFSKYAGTEIEVGGDKHLIIKEQDIIATLVERG